MTIPIDECHEFVTHMTYTEEYHEFVTCFFNKGHPLPGAFSIAIGCSISAQTLNKYSAVVVLVATYFSTKSNA